MTGTRGFLPEMSDELQGPLRVCTWFRINRDKLCKSQADFWVFVLNDGKDDERRIAAGVYENPVQDFTRCLNKDGWGALARKLSR